jgi:hypothetical protein
VQKANCLLTPESVPVVTRSYLKNSRLCVTVVSCSESCKGQCQCQWHWQWPGRTASGTSAACAYKQLEPPPTVFYKWLTAPTSGCGVHSGCAVCPAWLPFQREAAATARAARLAARAESAKLASSESTVCTKTRSMTIGTTIDWLTMIR